MLAPPVAAIRTAVRRSLTALAVPSHEAPSHEVPSHEAPLVLVACSGGADSLALAAAAGFVVPRLGWRVGLVTVDHGLQPGSGDRAKSVAHWAQDNGFEPVEVVTVTVSGRAGGPEAAARSARYEALAAAAHRLGGAAVLLGHTRDDQAETVLLALARGAGPRGLAGMAPVSWSPPAFSRVASRDTTHAGHPPPPADHNTTHTGHPPQPADRDTTHVAHPPPPADHNTTHAAHPPPPADRDAGPSSDHDDGSPSSSGHRPGDVAWVRPLLGISREQTRAACAALGLEPWDDPHNADPSYARARVRGSAIPALVDALGPGVVDNLARTARQLAADNAALDALAADALAAARTPDGSLAVAPLAGLPGAIRTRVLHAWARDLGVPGSALSHRHVEALDALVTAWHGQGPVHLPGAVTVTRRTYPRDGRSVATLVPDSLWWA